RSTRSWPCGARPPRPPGFARAARPGSTDHLQVLERQTGDQVLRLHAEDPVVAHGEDQVDRLIAERARRLAERPATQPDDAVARRLAERLAVPPAIADPGALAVEADIPGELRITHVDQRLDRDLDGQDVAHPAGDHGGEGGEALAPGSKIERHVEAVAAREIA